jgi:hypothetical protein
MGLLQTRVRISTVAWVVVALNGAGRLYFRIVDIPMWHQKTVADIPTDELVWVYASMIVLAVIGLIMHWGATIPFTLLGAFFFTLIPALTNKTGVEDAISQRVCAVIGFTIGLCIDLNRHWEHVHTTTDNDKPPRYTLN